MQGVFNGNCTAATDFFTVSNSINGITLMAHSNLLSIDLTLQGTTEIYACGVVVQGTYSLPEPSPSMTPTPTRSPASQNTWITGAPGMWGGYMNVNVDIYFVLD